MARQPPKRKLETGRPVEVRTLDHTGRRRRTIRENHTRVLRVHGLTRRDAVGHAAPFAFGPASLRLSFADVLVV